jgi:hypothetical protein
LKDLFPEPGADNGIAGSQNGADETEDNGIKPPTLQPVN